MRRSISMLAAGTAMVAMAAGAQTPPPTTPPSPAPFNSGSALDGLMNRAWAKMAEMDEAYKRCDAQAYERALRELEQMREEARLAGHAATGAAGFSNVDPAAAKGLARTLREMVRQRGWQLHDLRKQCARRSRQQPGATATQPPAPPVPAPQPPNCTPPPGDPAAARTGAKRARRDRGRRALGEGAGKGEAPGGRASRPGSKPRPPSASPRATPSGSPSSSRPSKASKRRSPT